jgi:hypothetical protein
LFSSILSSGDIQEVYQLEAKGCVVFQVVVEEEHEVHLLQSEQLIATGLPPVLPEKGVALAPGMFSGMTTCTGL